MLQPSVLKYRLVRPCPGIFQLFIYLKKENHNTQTILKWDNQPHVKLM